MYVKYLRVFIVVAFFLAPFFAELAPLSASAATMSSPFEISGWIPYWRTATGTADTLAHLNTFKEINPFVYTIKSDGTLVDNGALDKEPWTTLIAAARANHVRVIPTIMASNGTLLYKLLSNTKTRIALEDRITKLVKDNNFDGIDIDFEGKTAETRPYFSTFLKGLYQRMGQKWVMCTVESRTPIKDRYFGVTPPKDAGLYSNDYAAINKYCDRVRIMAYDQQGIDQALAHAASTTLYAPVADIAWVEKVMRVAMKDISKHKLVIGIPTYGYESEVTAYADGYVYDLLWSFNPKYALDIAAALGITPVRNRLTGEMNFSYIPTSTPVALPTDATTSPALLNNDQVGAAALALASSTNTHNTFRLMTWSDASAIADKVALAKRLGLRGVAIFKIDGGEDPAMWDAINGKILVQR